jgi:phosphoribosylamine---glycine ligase
MKILHTILVLGSGGREHALCYKLSQSQTVQKLYCATGNAGIAEYAECVSFNITNPQEVLEFCQEKNVNFVVIGSEAPAASGVTDILLANHIAVFGCSKQASMLEASKGFTKDICQKLNVPTAKYVRANNRDDALNALNHFQEPYVIKADGLAAGKGVVIAENKDMAIEAINAIFAGAFGQAGHEVVIEEFLTGEEASFFVLSDGKNVIPFGTAQDHKRAFDNDTGANTGGMGAYSPASIVTQSIEAEVLEKIIKPVIAEMNAQGTPFIGVLYAGLMLTAQGAKLIEFNVRFGDPECQVLMMRLTSDLCEVLYAVSTQTLLNLPPVTWSKDYAVTVVMASNGYPEKPILDSEVIILPKNIPDTAKIFHAGTVFDSNKNLIANGGRVLNVTATGSDIITATKNSYDILLQVTWKNCFYRSDIAYREIRRVM